VDLGRLSYFISTPQAHRIHHSVHPEHFNSNFGNIFMVWDLIFGTFRYDPANPPTAFGIDEKVPLSFVKQQLLPIAWIGRDAVASSQKLASSLSRTFSAN
jgi:sterol desaturase/sphingolipid hydroxylase (fatty acid hydroxylase superfamily)